MRRTILILAALTLGAGCKSAAVPTPSVLLFVFDTVRADFATPRFMPAFTALGEDGVVYEHAYAAAPWTLPSHGSLFTGLLPSVHGLGVSRIHVAAEPALLAERLARQGYQTMGISENPWISDEFGLTRGFAEFRSARPQISLDAYTEILADVLKTRDARRPLFLFVNVMDAHEPYLVRDAEPFLPANVAADAATALARGYYGLFCRDDVPASTWSTLRGLYAGGVARADAKLARTVALLAGERAERPLVVVATSDHGQHFGEHGLTTHLFSVHEELLHVPLVVAGLPDVSPARVRTPVGSTDVYDAILEWTRSGPGRGGGLPLSSGPEVDRTVESEFFDFGATGLADRSQLLQAFLDVRSHCPPEARVHGHMRALVHLPLKAIAFTDYPPALYDIVRDPAERDDLAAARPDELRALASRARGTWSVPPPSDEMPIASPELRERLRALGYATGVGEQGQ